MLPQLEAWSRIARIGCALNFYKQTKANQTKAPNQTRPAPLHTSAPRAFYMGTHKTEPPAPHTLSRSQFSLSHSASAARRTARAQTAPYSAPAACAGSHAAAKVGCQGCKELTCSHAAMRPNLFVGQITHHRFHPKLFVRPLNKRARQKLLGQCVAEHTRKPSRSQGHREATPACPTCSEALAFLDIT